MQVLLLSAAFAALAVIASHQESRAGDAPPAPAEPETLKSNTATLQTKKATSKPEECSAEEQRFCEGLNTNFLEFTCSKSIGNENGLPQCTASISAAATRICGRKPNQNTTDGKAKLPYWKDCITRQSKDVRKSCLSLKKNTTAKTFAVIDAHILGKMRSNCSVSFTQKPPAASAGQ